MKTMERVGDVTLADIGRALNRYRPFAATVVAILLVVWFAPGKQHPPAPSGSESAQSAPAPETATTAAPAAAPTEATAAPAAAATPARGRSTGTRVSAGLAAAEAGQVGPDCDTARHRIKIPTIYAPPCVAPYNGKNGGVTWQGVTADRIEIVVYISHFSAATQAALSAAGATDSREQQIQQVKDDVEYFSHHYETYGRKLNVDFFDATTNTDEYHDDRALADAQSINDTYHPFAVWGGPLQEGSFGDYLAKKGVLCFCTVGRPNKFYFDHAPYIWTVGPTGNQAFEHWGEFGGKRLCGRKAKWAGSEALKAQTRSFGVIYVETQDNAVGPSVDVFKQFMAKYGGPGCGVSDSASYSFDLAQAQEQARTIVAKFSAEGITTVVPITDPIYPVFFTNNARSQNYHPEYFCVGGLLTDTAVFARTYDQDQWSHCFGLSPLVARVPKELGDPYYLYQWQFGKDRTPPATNGYAVIYGPIWEFFTGYHLGGANLNPTTFRDGLFNFPPSGGGRTTLLTSWGRHGFWPYDDYGTFEDEVEIWWDKDAKGPDETQTAADCNDPSQNCTGLYAYVNGGKRYLVGQWPTTDPKAFDKNGISYIYDKLPPEDQRPEYPHVDYH